MKGIFNERNIVVALFIMVLITFSVAQNETTRIEHLYNGGQSTWKKFPNFNREAKTPVLFARQVRQNKST